MQQLNDARQIAKERSAKARYDIVGTIWRTEIMSLLGYDSVETKDTREAWEQIEEYMKYNVDKKISNDISEMMTHFGNCLEEEGFKAGFHIATRIFVEGMRGGAGL